jgi:hypothetical protein
VDVGALGFRVQSQVFCVEFHVLTFTTGSRCRGQKFPTVPESC